MFTYNDNTTQTLFKAKTCTCSDRRREITARAMSQENVEIVRPIYEALKRRDWGTVFRDMHPDFEMTTSEDPMPGRIGGGRRFRG